MSKKTLIVNLVFVVSLGLISSSNLYVDGTHSTLKGSGGPPYNTNAPGEKTCSGTEGTSPCHSGGIPDNSGPATCTITSTGGMVYVPGQSYTITCSVTHASRTEFGFQSSVRRVSNNTVAGNIVVTDAVKTWLHPVTYGSCQTCQFICHKAAGISFPGKTGSWKFRWTAPATNVGNIGIYACFNATNNNNAETGDEIYYTNIILTPSLTAITEQDLFSDVVIFPNPSIDGKFHIASEFNKVDKLEVYDVHGGLVLKQDMNSKGEFVLNKPSGVYFVSLFIEGKKVHRKVIAGQ